MIVDFLSEFANKQATTNNGYSDFTLDFQQEKPTTGLNTQDLYIVATVAEDVTGGFGFEVETADNAAFSSGNETVAKSTLVPTKAPAGTQVVVAFPRHHKRYMRLKWVGGCTGGKVSAHVTQSLQDNVAYKAHTGNA